jgi:hypothetical protein
MPIPSKQELLQWAENYVKYWNEGDKEAWVANWRSVAPGEFRMLDPVGTPEKIGFQEILDSWDLFQAIDKFRFADNSLFVCGNEVAWLLENHITSNGETFIGYSIETYRFEEDGSVIIKTYYRLPEKTDDELGDAFKVYLPEE